MCLGVIFDDDSEVHDIDAIILATGYKIGFPCLDEGLVTVVKNQVPLYKYVFPYDHKQHTMAIIGCLQPIGSTIPLSELQTRWACKVFSGESHLPSNEEMKEEMEFKKKAMAQRYYNSERHTIQVVLGAFVCFMLVLARIQRIQRNFIKLNQFQPWTHRINSCVRKRIAIFAVAP